MHSAPESVLESREQASVQSGKDSHVCTTAAVDCLSAGDDEHLLFRYSRGS